MMDIEEQSAHPTSVEALVVHLCVAPFAWLFAGFLMMLFWPVRNPSGLPVFGGLDFACFLPPLIVFHWLLVLGLAKAERLPWFVSRSEQPHSQRAATVFAYLIGVAVILTAIYPAVGLGGWQIYPGYIGNAMTGLAPIVLILGCAGRLPFLRGGGKV